MQVAPEPAQGPAPAGAPVAAPAAVPTALAAVPAAPKPKEPEPDLQDEQASGAQTL